MNRSDLVREVAGRTGLGVEASDAAVKAALAALAESLACGEAVRLVCQSAHRRRPSDTSQRPRA